MRVEEATILEVHGVRRSLERSKSWVWILLSRVFILSAKKGWLHWVRAKKEANSETSPEAIMRESDLLTGVLSERVVWPRSPEEG